MNTLVRILGASLMLLGIFGIHRAVAWDNCHDERPSDFIAGSVFFLAWLGYRKDYILNCPKCGFLIPASDAARSLASFVKNHNGGRPRSRKPRCYCGDSTMHTARMRGFDCCKKNGMMLKTKAR